MSRVQVLESMPPVLALSVVRRKRDVLLRDLDDLLGILGLDASDADITSRLKPIRDEILAILVTDVMSIEDLLVVNRHLSGLGVEIQKLLPD